MFLGVVTLELRNLPQNLRILLLVCFLFLVCFLLVAQSRGSFAQVDLEVNAWAVTIQTGAFTAAAVVVAYVFDTTSLIVISSDSGCVPVY
jgi:hypothetical protein